MARRMHSHVQRRFRCTVNPAHARLRIGNAAHAAGDEGEFAPGRFHERRNQRQRLHRATHIRMHHRIEDIIGGCLSCARIVAEHTGHVDCEVELLAIQRPCEGSHGFGFRHIQLQRQCAFGLQRFQRCGIARGRKHLPAVGQQLARELAADTARRADDQGSLHESVILRASQARARSLRRRQCTVMRCRACRRSSSMRRAR